MLGFESCSLAHNASFKTAGEDVEKLAPSDAAGGNAKMVQRLWKNLVVLKKLNMRPCNSTAVHLEMKIYVCRKACT